MTQAKSKVAVAVFAKTPGLSPIKTRLAAGCGKRHAEHLYGLFCNCIRDAVTDAFGGEAEKIWAVAEEVAVPLAEERHWRRMWQGAGDLGHKLGVVYRTLQRTSEKVLIIGTDSPQIDALWLRDAAATLDDSEFVIGPALDGGFWIIGGRAAIPSGIFEQVTYSTATTCKDVCARLESVARLGTTRTTFDIDTVDDLVKLRHDLEARRHLNPNQKALLEALSQGAP